MHKLVLLASLLPLFAAIGHAGEHARRSLRFAHPDGPYAPALIAEDFGNGRAGENRDFVAIRDGALEVTFKEAKKVNETGLGLHIRVPPREAYELQFRIRYPEDFEKGLHGKQLGMSGGRGYDGGRGEEARTNGDGWSVRLQFDALDKGVRNSLYVYHSQMTAKYGSSLNAGSFLLERGKWHEIRLRITMQTSPEASDGRIEAWLDGERGILAESVRFITKESGRSIDRLRMELFPGGGGAFPSRDHVIQIDDVRWRSVDPAR